MDCKTVTSNADAGRGQVIASCFTGAAEVRRLHELQPVQSVRALAQSILNFSSFGRRIHPIAVLRERQSVKVATDVEVQLSVNVEGAVSVGASLGDTDEKSFVTWAVKQAQKRTMVSHYLAHSDQEIQKLCQEIVNASLFATRPMQHELRLIQACLLRPEIVSQAMQELGVTQWLPKLSVLVAQYTNTLNPRSYLSMVVGCEDLMSRAESCTVEELHGLRDAILQGGNPRDWEEKAQRQLPLQSPVLAKKSDLIRYHWDRFLDAFWWLWARTAQREEAAQQALQSILEVLIEKHPNWLARIALEVMSDLASKPTSNTSLLLQRVWQGLLLVYKETGQWENMEIAMLDEISPWERNFRFEARKQLCGFDHHFLVDAQSVVTMQHVKALQQNRALFILLRASWYTESSYLNRVQVSQRLTESILHGPTPVIHALVLAELTPEFRDIYRVQQALPQSIYGPDLKDLAVNKLLQVWDKAVPEQREKLEAFLILQSWQIFNLLWKEAVQLALWMVEKEQLSTHAQNPLIQYLHYRFQRVLDGSKTLLQFCRAFTTSVNDKEVDALQRDQLLMRTLVSLQKPQLLLLMEKQELASFMREGHLLVLLKRLQPEGFAEKQFWISSASRYGARKVDLEGRLGLFLGYGWAPPNPPQEEREKWKQQVIQACVALQAYAERHDENQTYLRITFQIEQILDKSLSTYSLEERNAAKSAWESAKGLLATPTASVATDLKESPFPSTKQP